MTARPVPLACLLLVALTTPATPADQVIDVHLNDKVPAGKQPSLVVSVFRDLDLLGLELRSDGGARVEETRRNVPRDSRRAFELPQERAGNQHWRGRLIVTFPGGETSAMALDFSTEVVASLGLRVAERELGEGAGRVRLEAARALDSVDYQIVLADGRVRERGSLRPARPGGAVTLAWEAGDVEVVAVRLLARDRAGITEDLELYPWHYAIPHEELVFETGQAVVLPDEAPKLARSYELLRQGLAKYGRLMPVKLYVAGYTDTVAGADFNQELSERRALAIARAFRGLGFGQPIYYQGFGERGLKVPTPDETDELRNRRAEYVLAAEPPPMDLAGASSGWTLLREKP